jgi:lipopolysaccharide biosynthesis glycosyltransferase
MNLNDTSKIQLASLSEELFIVEVHEATNKEAYQDLKVKGHISHAAYTRFEIPSVLSKLERVIYLDADLIICDSLQELWDVDLDQQYVAAVENPFFNRHKSLWMSPESDYFNSGVMVLDLTLIRHDNIMEKALEHKKRPDNQDVFHDQDALNAVINGQWKKLSIKWNLQTIFLRKTKQFGSLKTEILAAYNNPCIVHYSSGAKPWEFADPHPLRHIFLNYYKGTILMPKGFRNIIRAMVKWCYLKCYYFGQIKI